MKEHEELIKTIKKETINGEEIVTIMCEFAYGDTPEELQLMAQRIKEMVRAGSIVHIIGK